MNESISKWVNDFINNNYDIMVIKVSRLSFFISLMKWEYGVLNVFKYNWEFIKNNLVWSSEFCWFYKKI